MWHQAQLYTCKNESHLSRVLRTNSHAKFSPNEGVIDEICNILKVLSIVLTERKKKKTHLGCSSHGHCWVPIQLPSPFPDFTEALPRPWRVSCLREADAIPHSSVDLISLNSTPHRCGVRNGGVTQTEAVSQRGGGGDLGSIRKPISLATWWNKWSIFL